MTDEEVQEAIASRLKTAKEAKAARQESYYDGKTCVNGQLWLKRVTDGKCTCAFCRNDRNAEQEEQYMRDSRAYFYSLKR